MDCLSSSASTVPSFDDYFSHNMWTPLLELLFLEQVSDIFASYLVETDLLIYSVTKVRMILHDVSSGTIAHASSLNKKMGTIVAPVASWSFCGWRFRYNIFLYLGTAVT